MKVNEFFDLREFVTPDMWEEFGEKSAWFLDPRLFDIAHYFRTEYGVIYINTWHFGGSITQCGLRPAGSLIGEPHSLHKYGRAIDLHFRDEKVEHVVEELNFNRLSDYGVRYIKPYNTHLHVDVRNANKLVFDK